MNITGDSAISSKSVEIVAEETAESFKALLIKALRIKLLLLQFLISRTKKLSKDII